ncbi:MAG: RloB domain-containing protein [Legionellales bacterium]|nr:RloB domain-containing protein [Legionellales bacterium]
MLYFKALIEELRLHPSNFKITNCHRNDPAGLVEFAVTLLKEYDYAFCIFDKDEHDNHQRNYTKALNRIEDLRKNKKEISAITSVPCFEYWLLLHFKDSTAPIINQPSYTASEQLTNELKKHIADYSKSYPHVFQYTKIHLETAIQRAKRIDIDLVQTAGNPSTKVYLLVEFLKKAAKEIFHG